MNITRVHIHCHIISCFLQKKQFQLSIHTTDALSLCSALCMLTVYIYYQGECIFNNITAIYVTTGHSITITDRPVIFIFNFINLTLIPFSPYRTWRILFRMGSLAQSVILFVTLLYSPVTDASHHSHFFSPSSNKRISDGILPPICQDQQDSLSIYYNF